MKSLSMIEIKNSIVGIRPRPIKGGGQWNYDLIEEVTNYVNGIDIVYTGDPFESAMNLVIEKKRVSNWDEPLTAMKQLQEQVGTNFNWSDKVLATVSGFVRQNKSYDQEFVLTDIKFDENQFDDKS